MLRNFFQNTLKRFASNLPNHSNSKYDIYAGIVIERLPVITKQFNDIENEVMELFKKMEKENSLKSDHEVRKEKDHRQQELLKSGRLDAEAETETIVLQTAQDFEDSGHDELFKFECAPRITEDDKNDNTRSLNRKLDDTLFFLCNYQVGKENLLLLPQGKWLKGETLRQTSERIVTEKCGPDLKIRFYGNAPVGFYKYKYPKDQRQNSVGAKIFFFRAIYNSGQISNEKLKYEWVNSQDLKAKIKSNSYYESVTSFCC